MSRRTLLLLVGIAIGSGLLLHLASNPRRHPEELGPAEPSPSVADPQLGGREQETPSEEEPQTAPLPVEGGMAIVGPASGEVEDVGLLALRTPWVSRSEHCASSRWRTGHSGGECLLTSARARSPIRVELAEARDLRVEVVWRDTGAPIAGCVLVPDTPEGHLEEPAPPATTNAEGVAILRGLPDDIRLRMVERER